MPTDGPADLVGVRRRDLGDGRRRMREEAKGGLRFHRLPPVSYVPPLEIRRRLEEWLKKPFSFPRSGNAQGVLVQTRV